MEPIWTVPTRFSYATAGFFVVTLVTSSSLTSVLDKRLHDQVSPIVMQLSFFFAQGFGAVCGGVCGDKKGRAWTMRWCAHILTILTIVMAIFPWSSVFTTPLMGFFSCAMYSLVATLAAESIEASLRHVLMATFFGAQGAASITVAGMIAFAEPYMLPLTLGVPLVILSVASFWLTEPEVYKQNSQIPMEMHVRRCTVSIVARLSQVPRYYGVFLPWLCFDFMFYGNSLYQFLLIHGGQSREERDLTSFFSESLTFIGTLTTIYLAGKLTPKLLQLLGFVTAAFVFFGLAVSLITVPSINGMAHRMGDVVAYDTMFRIFLCVPNFTTFLIPLEAAPTNMRCTVHGASAAIGRIGALTGIIYQYFVPEYMLTLGCCILAFTGATLTLLCTPMLPHDKELAFTTEALIAHDMDDQSDVTCAVLPRTGSLPPLHFGQEQEREKIARRSVTSPAMHRSWSPSLNASSYVSPSLDILDDASSSSFQRIVES